jgi:molybdopterin converting factor small subunit
MAILVKVYATLRKYTNGEGTIHLDQAETVKVVLETLGVPEKEVKNVIINGRRGGLYHRLTDGDRVALFPLIAGG